MPDAGKLPAPYQDPIFAQRFSLYEGFREQMLGFYSHSIADARPATNGPVFPVLIYSPGYGTHRRENTDKTEDLASHGYLIVGLDARDTEISVFPDGKVVVAAQADIVADIGRRVKDVQFVFDELARMNANDPLLAGRLDLDRIGAFGWSTGGVTAGEVCRTDSRCKAGAHMDGPFIVTSLRKPGAVQQPFMIMQQDYDFDYDVGLWGDLRKVFDALTHDAYRLKIRGATHGSFAEYELVVTGDAFARRNAAVIRSCLLSFFNKHLRGQDDHLLDNPAAAYPEINGFIRK